GEAGLRPVGRRALGGHDGRALPQEPSAESSACGGEVPALVIGQPEAAARPLSFEDSVLRHEVLDDVMLVAVDPSGEGHQQHLQGGNIRRHGPILPCPTLAHLPVGWAEYSDTTSGGYSAPSASSRRTTMGSATIRASAMS